MTALFVLIPLSLAMATFALGAFVWSVRGGQMDDLESPSSRMLIEDLPEKRTTMREGKRDGRE